ncbi:MAG: GldG family protein [Nitrospirota bacterium]
MKSLSISRSAKFGTNSLVMVIILAGILGILNLIFYKHNKRFDFTEIGSFSLSPQTLNILKGLNKEIKITAFYPEISRNKPRARDILDTYRYYSKNIRYEFIDLDKDPVAARRYGINRYGIIVVESDISKTKIKYLNEEELTNAIIRVSREDKKTIYFIEGHGEHSISDRESRRGFSQVKESLEKEGYEVRKVFLVQEDVIPDDVQAAVIAGPQRPFISHELEVVDSFLNRGGKLLILLDPDFDGGLQDLLKKWGIELYDDIIIDPLSRLFGGKYNIPVVKAYYQHEIIKDFNLPTLFPLSRSVSFNKEMEETILFQPIIHAGPTSWADMTPQSEALKFDPEKDKKTPVIAASLSYKNKKDLSKQGTLVIFGDSDFASNLYLNSLGNRDLFLNTISWLTEDKDLLSIGQREIKTTKLLLTRTQGNIIFNILVIILPASVFFIGIIVWIKRKRL